MSDCIMVKNYGLRNENLSESADFFSTLHNVNYDTYKNRLILMPLPGVSYTEKLLSYIFFAQ